MIDRNQIHEGMKVRSADGKQLGRVKACAEGEFVCGKGAFFSPDYVARYDDVAGVSGDEVQLARARDHLAHAARLPPEGGLGESLTVGLGAGLDPMGPAVMPSWRTAGEEGGRSMFAIEDDDPATTYPRDEPGPTPACHGDEGGGGLL